MLPPFHPRASLGSLLRTASRGAVLAGLAVLIAGGQPGCGNITLSSATELSPANGGASTPRPPDAAADAGATPSTSDGATSGPPPGASVDAGAAPVSTGNPLCFYSYAPDAGAHTCQPDTSSQCSGWLSADAGSYVPPAEDASDGSAPLSACHVSSSPNGQKCLQAGPGGDGAQCQTGTDCAESFECVGSPGQCRHYCCDGNAACDSAGGQMPGPSFCDVEATTSGGLMVPVCEPVRSCTPLLLGNGAGTCPKGETCAVVKDDGTTSCVPIGTVGIGGDCDVYHCAAELTCLGAVGSRTCFQLCEVDSPTACPAGKTCMSSAQLFTNANIGICQ